MFLLILLWPFVFLGCYLLPLLATFLSRDQSSKWVAFWLLQIVAAWTLFPFFGLFLEAELLLLVQLAFAFALFFLLNEEKVRMVSRRSRSSTRASTSSSASSRSRRTTPQPESQQSPRNTD